jgi:hypothetical protein
LRTRGRHRVPCRRYSSITNRRRRGRYPGLLVHGRLLLLILPEDDIAPPLVEDPGEEDEEDKGSDSPVMAPEYRHIPGETRHSRYTRSPHWDFYFYA